MMLFRERLLSGIPALGLWQALASPYTAEICARAGFDWLLIDGEHGPNTLQTLLGQLQAVAPFPLEAVARVPLGEPVAIKQYLDIGFRSLLVPMVNSAEQARMVVAATRFPPRGTRGVASATSRASGFGADTRYLVEAHAKVTVIAQIESREAVAAATDIAGTDGIDAVFIGPGDLAASFGHLGDPHHPEVQETIAATKSWVESATGKPVGIFAFSPQDAAQRVAEGYAFVSVGTDIGLLTKAVRQVLDDVRSSAPPA